MTRTLTAVGATLGACAVLLAASPARAQTHSTFGEKGEFILSADRLFSLFSYTHLSQDAFAPGPGNSKVVTTVNGTAFSLLAGSNPVISTQLGTIISPFTVPRVGLDYVLAPNFTLGGNLIFFFTLGGNTGQDVTTNGGTTTTTSVDNPGQFLFGIEPRAGYILPLTGILSVWLRGGFSYYVESSKTSTPNTSTTATFNQFALDLEPNLVVNLFPHVAFSGGLTLDIPITGGHSQDATTNGVTISQSAFQSLLFFGANVGLLTYF